VFVVTGNRLVFALIVLMLVVIRPSVAAEVKDGDTIILDGKSCRLDGIDAPERDQV
jgi:endonuclease YncB( thermonuclease family)